eukprot:8479638-Pyramimonas_sp.AAC.1
MGHAVGALLERAAGDDGNAYTVKGIGGDSVEAELIAGQEKSMLRLPLGQLADEIKAARLCFSALPCVVDG